MKNSFLKIPLVIITSALLAVSCTKEIPQKTYPSEITIDNWKEFVDAPDELIQELKLNHHSTLEVAAAPTKKLYPVDVKGDKLLQTYRGDVVTWNGSAWVGLGSVEIKYLAVTTYTNSGSHPGFYVLFKQGIHPICMEYLNKTGAGNGLDIFDIIMTQRHILGIQTFEQLDINQAPRRYVAADVVDDGLINSLDIDKMVGQILGTNTSPILNIAYVPTDLLTLPVVTNPAQLSGSFKSHCQEPPYIDRTVIKMGDVTGDNIL